MVMKFLFISRYAGLILAILLTTLFGLLTSVGCSCTSDRGSGINLLPIPTRWICEVKVEDEHREHPTGIEPAIFVVYPHDADVELVGPGGLVLVDYDPMMGPFGTSAEAFTTLEEGFYSLTVKSKADGEAIAHELIRVETDSVVSVIVSCRYE